MPQYERYPLTIIIEARSTPNPEIITTDFKMSSYTNINIQQPTSCQPGGPGYFFQLPAEIRNTIDDLTTHVRSENTFWPKFSQQEYAIKYLMPYGKATCAKSCQSADLKPTVLALAHTCRQAYFESSSRHYGTKTFVFASGDLLQKFVQEVSPMQVSSVKQLKIIKLARMAYDPNPACPNLGKEAVGPTSANICAAAWEDLVLEEAAYMDKLGRIAEQNINSLKKFHSLKTLTVGRKWLPEHEGLFEDHIEKLATVYESLPNLAEIVLMTDVPQELNIYPGLLNEFGHNPRCIYTTGESKHVQQGTYERITEILTRELV